MKNSYFDYTIDDISFFSLERVIKSLKRHFKGYPFDERSKEIISRVIEKKQLTEENRLKLGQILREEKKVSLTKKLKTGPFSQEIIDQTGIICTIIFIILFLFITSLLFNILINIEISSILKFLFFFINILSGTIALSHLYMLRKKIKPGCKLYFLGLPLSFILFLITSVWSWTEFSLETLYLTVFPFFICAITATGTAIGFVFIKFIIKAVQVIEIELYKKRRSLRGKKNKRGKSQR